MFIPAPFPVQGDCFGELMKVHWNHLSVYKRCFWDLITAFEWFPSQLDTRVKTWNWQRLFFAVNAVSPLSPKLHCWRELFCCNLPLRNKMALNVWGECLWCFHALNVVVVVRVSVSTRALRLFFCRFRRRNFSVSTALFCFVTTNNAASSEAFRSFDNTDTRRLWQRSAKSQLLVRVVRR